MFWIGFIVGLLAFVPILVIVNEIANRIEYRDF
jgi:hypothetical protein